MSNFLEELDEVMSELNLGYGSVYILRGKDGEEEIKDDISESEVVRVEYATVNYRGEEFGGDLVIYPRDKKVIMCHPSIFKPYDLEKEREIISDFVDKVKRKFREKGYELQYGISL